MILRLSVSVAGTARNRNMTQRNRNCNYKHRKTIPELVPNLSTFRPKAKIFFDTSASKEVFNYLPICTNLKNVLTLGKCLVGLFINKTLS